MSSQQQQQTGQDGMDMRKTVGFVVGVAQSMCRPWEIVGRKYGTFGSHYHGVHTLVGIAILFFSPALFGPEWGIQWLWVFLGITLVSLVIHRVKAAKAAARGEVRHSQDCGTPRVSFKHEPILVGAIGFACFIFSPALACYLIASSFALAVSMTYMQADMEARVRALRDARKEQEWLSEYMKNEMGEQPHPQSRPFQ